MTVYGSFMHYQFFFFCHICIFCYASFDHILCLVLYLFSLLKSICTYGLMLTCDWSTNTVTLNHRGGGSE
jgi:hypothetical protein